MPYYYEEDPRFPGDTASPSEDQSRARSERHVIPAIDIKPLILSSKSPTAAKLEPSSTIR
jgi:hypothetical protein